MVDRVLLEAAANATGHAWRWVKCPKFGDTDVPGMRAHDRVNGVEYWPGWNPLHDDGDALRLAVQLNMAVSIHTGHCMACAQLGPMRTETGDDTAAVTRRAITRAAAAIGSTHAK